MAMRGVAGTGRVAPRRAAQQRSRFPWQILLWPIYAMSFHGFSCHPVDRQYWTVPELQFQGLQCPQSTKMLRRFFVEPSTLGRLAKRIVWRGDKANVLWMSINPKAALRRADNEIRELVFSEMFVDETDIVGYVLRDPLANVDSPIRVSIVSERLLEFYAGE